MTGPATNFLRPSAKRKCRTLCSKIIKNFKKSTAIKQAQDPCEGPGQMLSVLFSFFFYNVLAFFLIQISIS